MSWHGLIAIQISSSQNISYAGEGEAKTWNADRKQLGSQGQRGKRDQKTFTSLHAQHCVVPRKKKVLDLPAGVIVADCARLARLHKAPSALVLIIVL